MKKANTIELFAKLYPYMIIAYIFTIILQTNFVYGNLIPNYIFSAIRYFVVIICALKIVLCDLKKYSIKSIYLLGVFLTIIVISSIVTKDRSLLQLYFLVIASRNIDIKIVIKKAGIAIFTLIIIIISLSLLKIIPNYVITRENSEILRYSLGFNYCTFPAIIIFSLSLVYVYIKENINFFDILGIFTTNFIMFLFTNTRMELMCTILFIITLLFYKYFNKNLLFEKIFGIICKSTLILLCVLSIFVASVYSKDNAFLEHVNRLASRRLELWSEVADNYKVNFWGNKISYYDVTNKNKNSFIIDNSYLDILYSDGIFLFLIIMYLFYALINYSIKKKDYRLLIILFITFIHSFVNPDLMMLKYNLFLLFLPLPFVRTNNDEQLKIDGITLEEMHGIQAQMLKQFKEYCENNNLRYYLCGGTLLGAIRHKGFIPWDDDIDVMMPRPDYEKLIELTKSVKNITSDISFSTYKNSKENMPYIKMFNENYKVEEEYGKLENGQFLWLDIFPMDGLSDNSRENKKLYDQIKFLRKIFSLRILDVNKIISSSKTKIKSIFKPFIKCIIDIVPVKCYAILIDKLSQKYDFKTSVYVGGVMWGYGPQERMLKEDVLKIVKVKFEGEEYDTFSCYEEYLHNLYNNYMQLPPKEKRNAHILKIVRVDSHEKTNNN